MESFRILGGAPLYGSVRLGGAKNASFKLMIASLLTKGESRLLNFSHISDVDLTAQIITHLGGEANRRGERTMFINARHVKKHTIPPDFGPASRAAAMFIPVLLHRLQKAVVPLPGGDKIGRRPLDRHLDGLINMGATIHITDGLIHARADRLHGTTYTFDKNTHTGTETMLMAAVLAEGKTVLKNAALEPEVDDLINFLNHMGARIHRYHHRVIEIDGVKELTPTIYRIMPDRNEAVSYACAAVATKGDIVVENANRDHLEAFLEKLEAMGGGIETGSYGIRFFYRGRLQATDIVTKPHPGFMTDWQPLYAILLTQAEGTGIIHETIYPQRFQYIEHLKEMGVKVRLFQPEHTNPGKVYNFNLNGNEVTGLHAVAISGPTSLKPGKFVVKDLRHGATLVIAAIVAQGTSIIKDVEQIDRGYEELDQRLRSMGAQIVRFSSHSGD